jgi:hypothetical protein
VSSLLKIYLIYNTGLKPLFLTIFSSLSLTLLVGCGSLGKDQVAKVHQAWNARYHYDLENRRMVSSYNNQKVGRTIGRDKWGRVDYDRFWVLKPFKGENLLDLHKTELDLKRGARWDEANRNLIEARKLELSQIASIEEGENDEGLIELEEPVEVNDEFIPAPFLPQGIDMSTEEPSSPDGLLPPFDNNSPLSPIPDAPDAPSPFAPLPPL